MLHACSRQARARSRRVRASSRPFLPSSISLDFINIAIASADITRDCIRARELGSRRSRKNKSTLIKESQ